MPFSMEMHLRMLNTRDLKMYACLLILLQRPAATRDINSVMIQPDRHDLHVFEQDLNNR